MLPMGCIVEYKGFACLVRAKMDSKLESESLPSSRVISPKEAIERLAILVNVELSYFDDSNSIVFVPWGSKKDKFVIAEARELLPEIEQGSVLRKEAYKGIFLDGEKRMQSANRFER